MLQSIGFYFSPLRDADDVASLMEAGSLIPPSTPSRAERIVTYLKTKVRSLVVNETEVMELFDRMHAGSGGGERFEAVMTRLPPSEGQVIVTDRTVCVIHLQRSFAAGCRQPATGARSSRPRQPSSHITALWAAARCCGCNARSVRRATTTRTRSVATCCLRAVPRSASTEHTVFESCVLFGYRQQCLHSHTSYKAFAKEYATLSVSAPFSRTMKPPRRGPSSSGMPGVHLSSSHGSRRWTPPFSREKDAA